MRNSTLWKDTIVLALCQALDLPRAPDATRGYNEYWYLPYDRYTRKPSLGARKAQMSGHSKWNNIKNRKGAADTKRASLFTQIAKLIRVAVKEGKSGDPKSNPSLRLMLEKARAANMPNHNIQRAIERGLGKSSSGAVIQEITYEAFGPGGVGMLIVAHTDNPNRTSSEVKFLLSRGGGSLGGPGSAMYLFERNKESGEYQTTMPIEIDETALEKLLELTESLEANDDVEQVFVATHLPDEEEIAA